MTHPHAELSWDPLLGATEAEHVDAEVQTEPAVVPQPPPGSPPVGLFASLHLQDSIRGATEVEHVDAEVQTEPEVVPPPPRGPPPLRLFASLHLQDSIRVAVHHIEDSIRQLERDRQQLLNVLTQL